MKTSKAGQTVIWEFPTVLAKMWCFLSWKSFNGSWSVKTLGYVLSNIETYSPGEKISDEGYKFFEGTNLVSLFSVPNYMGEFDNKGAIMLVDENSDTHFTSIEETESWKPSWR